MKQVKGYVNIANNNNIVNIEEIIEKCWLFGVSKPDIGGNLYHYLSMELGVEEGLLRSIVEEFGEYEFLAKLNENPIPKPHSANDSFGNNVICGPMTNTCGTCSCGTASCGTCYCNTGTCGTCLC